MTTTPVLIVIFNRVKETEDLVNALRKVKPSRVYVAADGPRKNNEQDRILCSQTRKVLSLINWKCKLVKSFSATNLGLRVRMSSAISWFFEHENAGIILEDDCIPSETYFRFCKELLSKYQDDERIMAIAGSNFLQGKQVSNYSYYYSKFAHCWGWATWKRAWKHYDDKMRLWPEARTMKLLTPIHDDRWSDMYWTNIFNLVYKNKINSWAYRWQFACWINNGLTILPKVNLVENIGFGQLATHTKQVDAKAQISAQDLDFPLIHPQYVARNVEADKITTRNRYLTWRVVAGLIKMQFMEKLI